MIKFTTVHKGQVRVLPDLTSQAGRGTSGVKKRSCARHGTLSRTLDLTQPDQPQPRVRSLRYHRRSLQTVLPSHRRRRTSRLQIPSFQSLAQCHFQLRAYEHGTCARLSQAEDDLRVLRYKRDDSLRDLNVFEEQNREWVADVNRWKVEVRVCLSPTLPRVIYLPSSVLTPALTCRQIVCYLWWRSHIPSSFFGNTQLNSLPPLHFSALDNTE